MKNLLPQFADKLLKHPSGKFLVYSWLLIILLLPLHGFLSVWLSSVFGHYLAWRSWKEALIISALFIGFVFLWFKDRQFLRQMASRPVNKLIALYVFLHLILSINSGINLEAIIYALTYNLRFLGFFLIAQIIGHYFKRSTVNDQRLNKLILVPAFIVIGFALLQFFILPNDFLTHFGYSPETIDPYVTIDAKEGWVRAQSFVRGPNQLGQYLILPLILLIALWIRRPTVKKFLLTLAGGTAIVASYSRSAWLGLLAAFGALLSADKSWLKWRRQIVTGLAVLVVLLGGLAFTSSSTDSFKLIIFHDDQVAGDAADSNTIRVNATRQSLEQIADEPVGYGPGYAGPASFHNDSDTKINENYYLQIALEVGVVGLLIFLAINWLVAINLWRQRSELWPRVLFSVFIGLFVINFFLPAWANDESLVLWGLMGLFYKR